MSGGLNAVNREGRGRRLPVRGPFLLLRGEDAHERKQTAHKKAPTSTTSEPLINNIYCNMTFACFSYVAKF